MWQIVAPILYFHPLQLQYSWLVLLAPFVTEGCFRQSVSNANQDNTYSGAERIYSPVDVNASHIHPCTLNESVTTNCLHGGACYLAILDDNTETFCHCGEEWSGTRCEKYFIDPAILATMQANMRTASIAAGIAVPILLLFICLFAGYVYIKKRKKRRKKGATNNNELNDPDTERNASADIGNGSTDLRLKYIDKQSSLKRDSMNNICVPEICHSSTDMGYGLTDHLLQPVDKHSSRRDDMNNICGPEMHSSHGAFGEQFTFDWADDV